MAGIAGIGSGLTNIDDLVKTAVAAEKAPKQNQLDKVEKNATTQITALGSLKSAVSEFQTALTTLNSPSSFLAKLANSSKSDVLTASATQKASSGSYQVEVTQIATSSKVALAAVPSDTSFSKGTLTVKVGETALPEIQIDANNNTLAGVRDALNKAGKELGLTATVVNDAQGARLVLSSSKTGATEDISVSVSGADDSGTQSLNKLAFSPSAAPTDSKTIDPPVPDDPAAARMLTRAKSAQLTVDGLAIVSKSNTVDQAIEGVTLSLKTTTTAGSPLTVGVSQDTGSVKGNITKFVDAYNALMKSIKAQTSVTSVGEDKAPVAGALVGDATARNLTSAIRNELVNIQGDSSSPIRALADLGITTQRDGTLAIDSTRLDKAISESPEGVATLLTGDNGLANRLKKQLDPYSSTGGILESRTKVLNETISKVDTQQAELDRRMTTLQARLYKQYNAMDSLLGQLNNTSSSLLASLDAMPWSTSSKS